MNPSDKEKLELYLEKADGLTSSGSYEAAIEIFNNALEIDPKNELALDHKGFALMNLGKYREALDILDEVLKIVPQSAIYLSNKGGCLNKIGKYQEAVEVCDEVLRINPKDVTALMIKGDSLSRLNKHQEAFEICDEVLGIDPKNEWALDQKNYSLLNLGKVQDFSCTKCGKKFSLSDQQYCSACGARLNHLVVQGQEYYGLLDELVRNNPRNVNTLSFKGNALNEQGKYKEALEYFNKALKIDPKNSLALKGKIFTLNGLGKYQEALEDCNEVLKIFPQDVRALTDKGFALYNLGKAQEVVVVLDEILKINPKDEKTLSLKRSILDELAKYQKTDEPLGTYLFFDTETTGLPRNWNAPVIDLDNWPRLIQIAWVLYKNGIKVSSSDFIIKPEGFKIPTDASNIHGITTERAEREGVPLQMVLNEFQNLVEQTDFLVAHNMSFDEMVVGAEFLRNSMPNILVSKKRICTKERSTSFCAIPSANGFNDYKWPKLSELHMKLFGTEYENSHNAIADVNATARCFWELKRRGIL